MSSTCKFVSKFVSKNSLFRLNNNMLWYWKVVDVFSAITRAGHKLHTQVFYDTLKLTPKNGWQEIQKKALAKEINLRYYGDGDVSIFLGN